MDAIRRVIGAAFVLTPVIGLAGCGDAVRPSQPALADDLAAHNGRVCPERPPLGEDPGGHGFGTDEPADSRPSLLTPDAGWVCRYNPTRVDRGPDGDGSTFRWQREGEAQPVKTDRLAELAPHLKELEPPAAEGCDDDLGSRWMLVYTHHGDLTGVVIDDYGCARVRLTDDPFQTAPGDSGQEGTAPGVLSGPPELLAAIKAGYSD